jgi:hypothetical protein
MSRFRKTPAAHADTMRGVPFSAHFTRLGLCPDRFNTGLST